MIRVSLKMVNLFSPLGGLEIPFDRVDAIDAVELLKLLVPAVQAEFDRGELREYSFTVAPVACPGVDDLLSA